VGEKKILNIQGSRKTTKLQMEDAEAVFFSVGFP
jgi:hypothetical protein